MAQTNWKVGWLFSTKPPSLKKKTRDYHSKDETTTDHALAIVQQSYDGRPLTTCNDTDIISWDAS
jgi:hypothetical protein